MRRGSPLLKHLGDLGNGDRPAIDRFDDEVVRFRIGQGAIPIGGNALIETAEPVAELSHGTCREVTKIPDREAGVLTADLHLAGKGEVVAAEDMGPGDKAGGEGFVMAVAQPDNPLVVLDRATGKTHFKYAKVAITLMTEGVRFGGELKPGIFELPLDLINEIAMRQRIPGFGGHGSGRVEDDFAIDGFSPAVKEHALRGCRSWGNDRFKGLYHDSRLV